MATEVRLTRRLHNSVKEALEREKCPSELKQELEQYVVNEDQPQKAAIPFRLVRKLWELSKDAGEGQHSMALHELLEDSEVYVEPPKPPQRSAELVARLGRLRAEQEQREYQKMVKNVDSNVEWGGERSSGEDTSVRSTSKQVSSIFNFILSLIGTFIFGYMASQYVFTIPMRILFGIFLAVIVGLAELYFMARTEI